MGGTAWRSTLLFSAGTLAAVRLAAQISFPGSELPIGNTTTFQAAPAAASSAAGAVAVAWQRQNPTNGGWDVYARQLSTAGVGGSEFQVNTTTGAACRQFPAVASDPAGNFIVAWQSDQSGAVKIWARRFDSSGQPLAAEFAVTGDAAFSRQFPAVAAAPDGKFLIVWQSDSQDGSSWGVYAQAYNGDGSVARPEFLVNTTTAGAQHSPAVTFINSMAGIDLFEVVWQSEGKDGAGAGPSGIFMQTVDGGGTLRGSETAVNTPLTGAQGRPRIAGDPSGNYVVVWENVTSAGSGAYFRRFNSAGTPLSGQIAVDSATVGSQRNPAVTCDAIGNFVVTWDSLGQDGDGAAVLAEELDNNAMLRGSKVLVNTTFPGDQSFAVPVGSAGGSLWIVWQSQTPAGDNSIIAARQANLALSFYTMAPCRLIDTRNQNGTFGGPILTSGMPRNFPATSNPSCVIPTTPTTPKALSLNVTVVGATSGGSLTLYPGDGTLPATSNINFGAGQTRSNNAVIPLSLNGDGSLEIRSSQAQVGGSAGKVHVIVDVNGYFE